jgi:hypothetical protein
MLKFYYFFNYYLKQDFLIKYNINLHNFLTLLKFNLFFYLKNIKNEKNNIFFKIRWIFSFFTDQNKIYIEKFKMNIIENENVFSFICNITLKKKHFFLFFSKLWFLFQSYLKDILNLKFYLKENIILIKLTNLSNIAPFKEELLSWNLPIYIKCQNIKKNIDKNFIYNIYKLLFNYFFQTIRKN